MSDQTIIEHKTLADVVADLWQARGMIVFGALVGIVAAAGFVALASDQYRAQIIISPANPMNGAEVSSLLADDNLFAMRYLVQRVGIANSGDFTRFETIYSGPSVAEILLKDPAIARGLAQDKRFSFEKGQSDWSAAELAEYIDREVRFENVGTTTMRRMVYKHHSPDFAKYLLTNIHRVSDALIRQGIKRDASRHIRYLQDTIAEMRNPEHRKAMTALMMEQERLLMLVSIESPYAASVIEPAASSARAVWPNAALMIPVGAMIGAMLGFAVFNVRRAFSAGAQQRQSAAAPRTQAPHRDIRKHGYWWKMDAGNANDGLALEAAEEDEADRA